MIAKNPLSSDVHHSYHMHQFCPDDLEHKRFAKPSHKQTTDDFSSFAGAVSYFIQKCSIIGLEDVFELSDIIGELDGQYMLE